MAASKTIKKAPPKTAAPKKAAAKKVKRAPKKTKTAPSGDIPIDYKGVPRAALREANGLPPEDVIESIPEESPAPEETVTEEVEEIPAPPVVQRPGRVAPIKTEPILPTIEPVFQEPEPILPIPEPVISVSHTLESPEATVVTTTTHADPPEAVPTPEHEEGALKKVEVKILDVIKALWHKIESWKYFKWVAIGLAIFLVIYAIDTVRVIKRNHDIKQTKKMEAKVSQKEEQVRLTDSSIAEMQRLGDSLREVSDSEIQEAIKHTQASQDANQKRVNLIKLQRYELDNKIKSFNNNDDRRKLQKQLTSPQ